MSDFTPLFPRAQLPPTEAAGDAGGGSFAPARLSLGWRILNDFAAPLPPLAPRGLR